MATIGLVTLYVFAVTGVAVWGVLYRAYCRWPPRAWKAGLARHCSVLQAQIRTLQRPDASNPTGSWEREHFTRHLATISVDALDSYPGIGRTTIARLRQCGYADLQDLQRGGFERIAGIGPKRRGDICAAVTHLTHDASEQFASGHCAEAIDLKRRKAAWEEEARQRDSRRQRDLAAVREALHRSKELESIANLITFRAYLRREEPSGVLEGLPARFPQPGDAATPPPMPKPVTSELGKPLPPAPRTAGTRVAARAPGMSISTPVAPSPAPVEWPIKTHEAQPHPWLSKMRTVAAVAYVVAKADGRVDEPERRAIRSFLTCKFGHDDRLVRHIDPMMERFEGARVDEKNVLAFLAAGTTEAERHELYKFAEEVADACGAREAGELLALARIAWAFGLHVEDSRRQAPKAAGAKQPVANTPAAARSPASPPTPATTPAAAPELAAPEPLEPGDARALLDIPERAELDADLVRRRYHFMMDKLDQVQAIELGSEFVQLVQDKRLRLKEAAEVLLAPFGAPLEAGAAPRVADPRHNPDLDAAFGA